MKGFFISNSDSMNIAELHQLFLKSKGVSTDSRTELIDKIFFALKGDNFDGNRFALKSLEKGAVLSVVDDPMLKNKEGVIWVEDVLQTLQQLANFHRNHLKLPIIAITGSNGKTTTKELIAKVLSERYKVGFTRGNLNNHIGVPLTLLSLKKSTEIGVVEMGANHPKEIKKLCRIVQPDFGYITNFGKAHLEGFGSFEGVVKGKSELYDYLIKNNKQIFVNEDQKLQIKQSKGGNLIKFGQSPLASCQVSLADATGFIKVKYSGVIIKSKLLGAYNFNNIAAAICVGQFFEIDKWKIKKAIETYKPENNRSQIFIKGSNKFILDAYNANPTSMELAIANLINFRSNNKVVVLGDMFEIGETELEEHQQIVDLLEASSIEKIYVCGGIFNRTKVNKVRKFENFAALKHEIAQENIRNSTVLIKGSRGMAMEKILEAFN